MPKYKDLSEITESDITTAAAWWYTERTGWIGQRAVPVWLIYEGGFQWNPDDPADAARYDDVFRRVFEAFKKGGQDQS